MSFITKFSDHIEIHVYSFTDYEQNSDDDGEEGGESNNAANLTGNIFINHHFN